MTAFVPFFYQIVLDSVIKIATHCFSYNIFTSHYRLAPNPC